MPTPRQTAPARPPIPTLTVDGVERPFNLDVGAWCRLEERYGKSTDQLIGEFAQHPSFRVIRTMTALALSTKDEVFSEDEASDVIAEHGMTTIANLVSQSVERLMGGPAKAD